MGVNTNEQVPVEEQPVEKHSSDDIEKAPETAVHTETQDKTVDYIPQSDEEYNVTFKTWIVVSVGTPSTLSGFRSQD